MIYFIIAIVVIPMMIGASMERQTAQEIADNKRRATGWVPIMERPWRWKVKFFSITMASIYGPIFIYLLFFQ